MEQKDSAKLLQIIGSNTRSKDVPTLSRNRLVSTSSSSNLSRMAIEPPSVPTEFLYQQITMPLKEGVLKKASASQQQLTEDGTNRLSKDLENRIVFIDNSVGEPNLDDIIPNWVPIDRCIEKVITTYDYEGLREDELSFKENMYIYVIKKNDDHWYEGIMKNENGDIIQGNKKLK